jgi:DNA-binding PadR family transcriptional regulator
LKQFKTLEDFVGTHFIMFNIAQKNTLQYIILGMLQDDKKTGYDIKTAFTTEIGEFWQAKHSQIYPELSKLTKKGWIH